MKIWKVELFKNKTDKTPFRWGVVAANTEEEATQIVINHMNATERATLENKRIGEITSLPEGTFFWKA